MSGRWLPLCWTQDAGSARPRAVVLDGRALAVCRDASGTLFGVEDRCPHRAFPLSRGRVVAGELQCGYHGWRFDSAGRCIAVPGLTTPPPRVAVPAVPVAERDGLAWGWTGDGPPDELPVVSSGAGPSSLQLRWSFTLDGALEDVAENVLDVPHTAFLHGGLFRSPGDGKHVQVEVHRTASSIEARFLGEPVPSGLLGRMLVPGGGTVHHVDRFILPCVAQVEYAVGRFRLLATSYLAPDGAARTRAWHVLSVAPRWAAAMALPALGPLAWWVLRQDASALRAQSRNEARFPDRARVSTEADVLGPHVEQMLARARRGEAPLPDAAWSVTLRR